MLSAWFYVLAGKLRTSADTGPSDNLLSALPQFSLLTLAQSAHFSSPLPFIFLVNLGICSFSYVPRNLRWCSPPPSSTLSVSHQAGSFQLEDSCRLEAVDTAAQGLVCTYRRFSSSQKRCGIMFLPALTSSLASGDVWLLLYTFMSWKYLPSTARISGNQWQILVQCRCEMLDSSMKSCFK